MLLKKKKRLVHKNIPTDFPSGHNAFSSRFALLTSYARGYSSSPASLRSYWKHLNHSYTHSTLTIGLFFFFKHCTHLVYFILFFTRNFIKTNNEYRRVYKNAQWLSQTKSTLKTAGNFIVLQRHVYRRNNNKNKV